MSCLTDIQACIKSTALVDGASKNHLEERQTSTKIQITTDGAYLQYDFEKIRQPLFPFFEATSAVKGLNSIADKVIFSEDKRGNVWVFIIELKLGKGNHDKQIHATKQFIQYLITSINRVCRTNHNITIRGLGYSKNHRPTTKFKNPYNTNEIAYFTGNKLNLSLYRI
jgi:hypothetical protein